MFPRGSFTNNVKISSSIELQSPQEKKGRKGDYSRIEIEPNYTEMNGRPNLSGAASKYAPELFLPIESFAPELIPNLYSKAKHANLEKNVSEKMKFPANAVQRIIHFY